MKISAIAGLMAGSMLFAASASAGGGVIPDLTGQWATTYICDALDGPNYLSFSGKDTFLVRQTGARFDALAVSSTPGQNLLYIGHVNATSSGAVEAVSIACGGDYKAHEVIRLRTVIVSIQQTLMLGDSNFFENVLTPGVFDSESCKYTSKRVSTTRPTFAGCGS